MSQEDIHNELMDVLQCVFRYEFTDGRGVLNQHISRYNAQPLDIRKDDFWDNYMEYMLLQQFYSRGTFWEYYNTRYRLNISKKDYIRYFEEQTNIQKELYNRKYQYVYEGRHYKAEIGLFLSFNYDTNFKIQLRTWAEGEFFEEFMIIPK